MKASLFLLLLLPTLGISQWNAQVSIISSVTSPTYRIIESDHGEILNRQRAGRGSSPLMRSRELDSLAFLRCLRMVRKLEEEPINILDVQQRESHREAKTAENTGMRVYGMAIWASDKNVPSADSIRQLFFSKLRFFKDGPSGGFYDDSPGHVNNRTNARWQEFGDAAVLVLLKVKKSPRDENQAAADVTVKLLWIHYELFR